jgi:hypothetical protein
MTKTQKALIIGLPVLIGGYLIYKQFRGKKTYQEAVIENPPGTEEQGEKFKKYKVTTLVTPLNIREEPSTSSAKIGSLPKGSIIYAAASSTNGWMIYSEDGSNESGYVSADYLTAI